MVISTNIIWISSNKNNEINKFLKDLENLPFYKINIFNSIEESINKIKIIRFEETFIIINGNLYIQFIETFQNNLKNIYILPKIIIFTENKEEFINKNIKYKKLINNSFYNSGIKTNIKEINNFILNSMHKKKELLNIKEDKQLSFEQIDCKEKLLLPIYYKTLIGLSQNDNIEQFTKSLCNKYCNKNNELDIIFNSLNTTSDIPIEILSKYYAKAYIDQDSHFYNDINKDLIEKNQNNYLSYIKVLYEGIKLQSLQLSNDKMLYHGSILLNKDIEKMKNYLNNKIENLPGATLFSKAFLSFNKDKNYEKNLLNLIGNKNKESSKVLFILEKDENIDYSLSTHIDLEKLTNEKEVLFLPFSSFEINNINEINVNNEKIYEIKLLYLGKYIKEFQKDKMNEKIIPETEFKQEIIKYGLITSDILNKNNNNKELIKRYEEYNLDKNKSENNNIENINQKKDEKENTNNINKKQITVNKTNFIKKK